MTRRTITILPVVIQTRMNCDRVQLFIVFFSSFVKSSEGNNLLFATEILAYSNTSALFAGFD